jgi:hypothetical protein
VVNICWYVIDVVYGFFDTCIGINTIISTKALKESINSIAGEVLGAIKAHVFQEMGQSALVVFFLQTAYTLSQIEACSVFWPIIVFDVICQAIWQGANPYCCVNRNQR